MFATTLLLISHDHNLVRTIRSICGSIPQLKLKTCGEPELARPHLRRGGVALILIHLVKGQTDESITTLLHTLKTKLCNCAVVVLANDRDEARTNSLLRAGVADCLDVPLDINRLTQLVDSLTLRTHLAAPDTVADSDEAGELAETFPQGPSELIDQLRRVAAQDTTVMLTGETGTGKSRLARLIHQSSPRRDLPFQVVDCGALAPALIESTLFGHVRGAFTGADCDRAGKLASVGRGTLLLDEINLLPAASQCKLLRAVDERVFEPVGSDRSQPVQARLIAASNVPLEREVAAGRFRADLYYRLNVVGFCLPPLRENPQRIAPLVSKFVSELSAQNRPDIRGISTKALRALEKYGWPGNIRELQNVVERAVALSAGPKVQLDDLPETIRHHSGVSAAATQRSKAIAPTGPFSSGTLDQTTEAAEIQCIILALKKHNSNRSRAAADLGISRMGLYKKLRRYGLNQILARASNS